jgi:hypothetical protein
MTISLELSRFQDDHERLWELLFGYQTALMGVELEMARACAESLYYELRVHRGVEDQVLLPLFRELGLESEGARLELFIAEHQKLGKLALGLIEEVERLEALAAEGELGARDCLAGIEQAFTFKHLFDHHTKRENAAMYPVLCAAVGDADRAAVWSRMDAAEQELRRQLGPAPAPISIP